MRLPIWSAAIGTATTWLVSGTVGVTRTFTGRLQSSVGGWASVWASRKGGARGAPTAAAARRQRPASWASAVAGASPLLVEHLQQPGTVGALVIERLVRPRQVLLGAGEVAAERLDVLVGEGGEPAKQVHLHGAGRRDRASDQAAPPAPVKRWVPSGRGTAPVRIPGRQLLVEVAAGRLLVDDDGVRDEPRLPARERGGGGRGRRPRSTPGSTPRPCPRPRARRLAEPQRRTLSRSRGGEASSRWGRRSRSPDPRRGACRLGSNASARVLHPAVGEEHAASPTRPAFGRASSGVHEGVDPTGRDLDVVVQEGNGSGHGRRRHHGCSRRRSRALTGRSTTTAPVTVLLDEGPDGRRPRR